MSAVTLKISSGGELRRLTVNPTDSPTLAQVVGQIRRLFPFLDERLPVPLKYADDEGDLVTLASDADWQEAVNFAREGGKNLIRLTLGAQPSVPMETTESSTPKESRKEPLPLDPTESMETSNEPEPPAAFSLETLLPFLGQALQSSFPSSSSSSSSFSFANSSTAGKGSEGESSVPAGKPHHEGITCDGCNGPIRGIRYKCAECYDFDLCEECEAKGEHPAHHVTLKIRIPTRVEIWHPYAFRRGPPMHQEGNPNRHGCQRKSRCPRWGGSQQQAFSTESEAETQPSHPHHAHPHPHCQRNLFHQYHHQQQQQQQQQEQQEQEQEQCQYQQPPQEQPEEKKQPPQQEQQHQSQEEEIPSEFAEAVRILEEMGFFDRETNVRLLRERRGRIEEVVAKLTQLSFD